MRMRLTMAFIVGMICGASGLLLSQGEYLAALLHAVAIAVFLTPISWLINCCFFTADGKDRW